MCATSTKSETSLSLAIPTPHIVLAAHMHPQISQPQPPAIQEPTSIRSQSSVHWSRAQSASQASPISFGNGPHNTQAQGLDDLIGVVVADSSNDSNSSGAISLDVVTSIQNHPMVTQAQT